MSGRTGSRRLLTYRRLKDAEISTDALAAYAVQRLELQAGTHIGSMSTANDLNDFRKKVCGFQSSRYVPTSVAADRNLFFTVL